ncbi:MAG: hypothetical protein HY928_07595 [Elusimicrobia bacterium]|nr:hypothetical protein [Elusimicrobiota bacterium]
MRRLTLAVALLSVALCGCEDEPSGKQGPTEDDGGGMHGASATTGGSSGDVAIASPSEGTIADRYEKALKLIKEKDWDGARDQLLEAYRRSDSADVKKEIRGHLGMVEQGIRAQPALSAAEVFAGAPALMEKKVSMRGTLLQGGQVAKVTYYFWLQAGAKIQCRFSALTLEEKRLIQTLPDGSDVLVRGTLKPAWGSNPNPYLELSYFRLERRPPDPKPEGAKP